MTYTKACVELARAYDASAPQVDAIREAERVAMIAFQRRPHSRSDLETAIDVMLAEGRMARKPGHVTCACVSCVGPWF
jgi:hypothetical protein